MERFYDTRLALDFLCTFSSHNWPTFSHSRPIWAYPDAHAYIFQQEEADPSDDQNPDQQDLQFPDNQKEEAAVASGTKSEGERFLCETSFVMHCNNPPAH